MARGIESGTPNPAYQRLQAQLAGARAAQEAGMSSEQLQAQANRMFPPLRQPTRSIFFPYALAGARPKAA